MFSVTEYTWRPQGSNGKGILDLESLIGYKSEEMLNLPCGEKSVFLSSSHFIIAVWKDGIR
jgi:hypothetical protein